MGLTEFVFRLLEVRLSTAEDLYSPILLLVVTVNFLCAHLNNSINNVTT